MSHALEKNDMQVDRLESLSHALEKNDMQVDRLESLSHVLHRFNAFAGIPRRCR